VAAGSPATVKANFTDQGILDTHTCNFSWGDSTNSPADVITETNATPPASFMSGSCTASHSYTAAGTYTVYVTAFDNDQASGVSGAITITVTAPNSAPVLSSLSITSPVKENVNATLTGTFTDQNSTGTHKVTYEWGDGTANTVQTLSATIFNFSATHKYANETPAVTVTVTVTDSGNLSDSKTLTFAVINAAPVITSGTVPASTKILPGGTVTISPAFTDAPQDAHTCDYVWEVGGATETVTASPAVGNGSCTKSHTYPTAGVYNGSVTVKDDAGATATATFKVIVDTKPANLTLSAPSEITENDTATVSGSFTDPDSTHKITIAWGDGSANTVVNLAAAVPTFSSTHKYKDNNPAATPAGYTVTVTVLDNNSLDSISSSATIKVNNALPQITSTGSNVSLPLWINFTDAGTLDTHTCAVTWGDGQTGSGVVNESNGSGYCSGSHSYSSAGTYTVGVTITDKDGGSDTRTYQYIKP
jgi:PKD repeat protein